jgi:hypothetical protein
MHTQAGFELQWWANTPTTYIYRPCLLGRKKIILVTWSVGKAVGPDTLMNVASA